MKLGVYQVLEQGPWYKRKTEVNNDSRKADNADGTQ